MGNHAEMDSYFEGKQDSWRTEFNSFLTHALLYTNNTNGAEVFESTYNRPFDPEDGYCVGKVEGLQKRFDSWFLSLDLTNRLNFTNAVMLYMSRVRN